MGRSQSLDDACRASSAPQRTRDNANPASPKAKALTRNALMGLAGFGLVYYAHKLYKDRA